MIEWRKSSRSQGDLVNTDCVELSTNTPHTTLIQDSKNPGAYLTLSASELTSFMTRIKSGHLHH
ncbi:DUF397 domain-containing protein [Actinocorallia sp. A-T 12471]|uniref:DUF397 domain-containing protein n=1 Tax=Actinocorallia sp. A-T 12471 TaxID=3089813 RepID=UPI0029CC97C2|nr:DUF397 domain-containing protein [Actinocorallia sp. A-T 12471]MDX6743809.1 DUF397 domain-containing protein [Actinocorallia sp. A-T 12471]